jgi:hypothetical protein
MAVVSRRLAMRHRGNRHGPAFSTLYPRLRAFLRAKAWKIGGSPMDPDDVEDVAADALIEFERVLRRWRHSCPICGDVFLLGRDLRRHGELEHQVRGLRSAVNAARFALLSALYRVKKGVQEVKEYRRVNKRLGAMVLVAPGPSCEAALLEALEIGRRYVHDHQTTDHRG